jgi:hypothetical protein
LQHCKRLIPLLETTEFFQGTAMSTISIQVTVGTTPPSAPIAKTVVALTDSAGAAQSVSLDGTESPVGFIPSVTVAPGAGTIVITAQDATGATLGTPVNMPYTTTGTVTTGQFLPNGATVVVLTP